MHHGLIELELSCGSKVATFLNYPGLAAWLGGDDRLPMTYCTKAYAHGSERHSTIA